jgi:hypothetical protein
LPAGFDREAEAESQTAGSVSKTFYKKVEGKKLFSCLFFPSVFYRVSGRFSV